MWSVVLALLGTVAPQEKAEVAPKSCLKLERAFELPKVEGRIDHMAFEGNPKQLVIAARDNGTLEFVNFFLGKVEGPSPEPELPQGIVYVDEIDTFIATDGKLGCVWRCETPFALNSDLNAPKDLRPDKKRGVVGPDADNIRWLPHRKRLLIGHGDGALGFMALHEYLLYDDIELGGHPESFQIDAAEKRCWVNVPDKQAIGVVDLEAKKVARWIDMKAAKQNYPMALAEKDKRLLIGCRDPSKLLVFDIDSDAMTAELPLSGDVDDIFVDDERGLVYASCGEGFVDVFERVKAGEWKPKEKVATSAGARTCLFVPTEKKLFVAVPHRGEQKAEVRVFSTAP